MKFGLIAQTRIALGRPLLRALFAPGAAWLRHKLLGQRADGLDPDLSLMLALDARTADSQLWRWPPQKARRKLAESVALVQGPVPADDRCAVQELTIPIPSGELAARLYAMPETPRPAPGLVYLHGGGWVTGDLDTHDLLCRQLSRDAGLRVVSVAYRLAPEQPFPAAVNDSLAAFRHVAAHAAALGLDPACIGVAGDSAGGNLAAVVSLRTRGESLRPALAVLLYPALDARCQLPSHAELGHGLFLTREAIDWYYGHYLGPDPARRIDPDASPLLAVDVSGAPPTLVIAAALDPLRDEAAAYAERLRLAGVPVRYRCLPGLLHGFALMTGLSAAARAATQELARQLGQALREGLAAALPG